MSDTPILTLPEIAESQAGKYLIHNEAINRLEGVLVRVLSATTMAEPGSPSEGDTYIVPASATGTDWAGQDDNIAHYYGGAWHFYAPVEGLAIYSTGDAKTYRYLSSAWGEAAGGGGGASDFTDLGDVPSAYADAAGQTVKVNATEDGLEFVADVAEGVVVPYDEAINALEPVAYWRLGEVAGPTCNDEVGETDLTYANVTLGTTGLLVDDADDAATFNGSSSIASAIDVPAAFATDPDAFSIAFLIKFAVVNTRQIFMRVENGGGDGLITLQLHGDTTGLLSMDKYPTSDANGQLNSTLQPAADTVYHVVYVEDADGRVFYIDGTPDNSDETPEVFSGSAQDRMKLGSLGSSFWFQGVLDEVAMFDKALTADQVAALYASSRGLPTDSTLDYVGRNYLINPDFAINQRAFAGGSLGDGVYGYDRWKADGSSSITAVDGSGYVTLTSGTLEQVLEAPGLAGKIVTLDADTGGTTVAGEIDGQTGNLPLTVTVDAGSTGNISIKLTGGKVKNLRLVEGTVADTYQARPFTEELLLCQRYFSKSYPSDTAPGSVAGGHPYCYAIGTGKDLHLGNVMAPVEMRASPTVTLYSPNDGTADAIYNETGTANHVAAAVNTTKNCIGYPQIDAGASAPSADDLFAFHWTADAEI